jgi:hypothetical protein
MLSRLPAVSPSNSTHNTCIKIENLLFLIVESKEPSLSPQASVPHFAAQMGIRRESLKRLCEALDVAMRAQKARLPVRHDFRQTSNGAGNYRDAVAHGLQYDARTGFEALRVKQDVDPTVDAAHVRSKACEGHRGLTIEVCYGCFKPPFLWPLADENQTGFRKHFGMLEGE